MKKIALALAFAGLAMSASAETQIYGVVDMGLSRDIGNGVTGLDSGLQSGSRIGFRGKEDLGNGTSVIYTIEAGFNADNGTMSDPGRLFNRQSWIGLQGPLGTVKLGRQITPLWSSLDSVDPFASGLAGDATRLFNDGGKRMNNTVNYSNTLFGVNAQVAYGFGEKSTSANDGRVVGFAANKSFGPVYTTVGYHNAEVTGGHDKTVLVGSTVSLTEKMKVHGVVANNEELNVKSRDYLVGASFKATGVDTFMGSVIRHDGRTTGQDATQYALGWSHHLSARTNLYTSYGQTKFDTAPTAKVVNVGIRHRF